MEPQQDMLSLDQVLRSPVHVWICHVGCLGNESKLSHCIHPGAGNVGNCSHTQDAGVQCSGIKGEAINVQ